jgi:hypothetical protein
VKLAYAGLDGVTVDGTNQSLNDPIAAGLASLGVAAAGLAVADPDLLAVDSIAARQLLDVAELRALESILGNKASPDQRALNSYLYEGRFYAQLQKTIAYKNSQVEREYGIGVPTVSAGVLDLGFAATTDPTTGVPR